MVRGDEGQCLGLRCSESASSFCVYLSGGGGALRLQETLCLHCPFFFFSFVLLRVGTPLPSPPPPPSAPTLVMKCVGVGEGGGSGRFVSLCPSVCMYGVCPDQVETRKVDM